MQSQDQDYPIEYVDISNIHTSFGGDNEPKDPKLLELLAQAYKGEIDCRRAVVKTELIKPFSDFKPDITQEFREYFTKAFNEMKQPELYVYQAADKFIMSDDYRAYYMYKELNSPIAICTVIGPSTITGDVDYGPSFKFRLSDSNH